MSNFSITLHTSLLNLKKDKLMYATWDIVQCDLIDAFLTLHHIQYITWSCIVCNCICVSSVQVFKELLDFDVSDAFGIPKDDGHFWWPGLSSKRRRRSSVFPWHWDITKDARFAFTVRTHTKFRSPQWWCRNKKKKVVILVCVYVFISFYV